MSLMYDEEYGIELDERKIAHFNRYGGRFPWNLGRLYRKYSNYGKPTFPESAEGIAAHTVAVDIYEDGNLKLRRLTKPASEDLNKVSTIPEFSKAMVLAYLEKCGGPDPLMALIGRQLARDTDAALMRGFNEPL